MGQMNRRKLLLRVYIERSLLAVTVALVMRIFVITPIQIPSDSMEPVLIKGDYAFAYTLPFGISLPMLKDKIGKSSLPKRGDVVLYRYELDRYSLFVKRVMGLPGDKIEIKNGQLFVNNEGRAKITEDVVLPPFLLPQGSLFLIAESPLKSDDLQYWSVISKDRVLGRIITIWLSIDSSSRKINWNRIFKSVH